MNLLDSDEDSLLPGEDDSNDPIGQSNFNEQSTDCNARDTKQAGPTARKAQALKLMERDIPKHSHGINGFNEPEPSHLDEDFAPNEKDGTSSVEALKTLSEILVNEKRILSNKMEEVANLHGLSVNRCLSGAEARKHLAERGLKRKNIATGMDENGKYICFLQRRL